MFHFVGIIFISGIYGCEKDRYNSNTVLYFDGEILNLTISEHAYPDDIEVTKLRGACSSPMPRLPDENFDDTTKKYEHLKEIKVPMTSAMHECAYDMTMRARSACLVRRLVRFEMRAPLPKPAAQSAAPPAAQSGRVRCPCSLGVALRWREEVRARFAAETLFVCDPEHALCEQRDHAVRRDIVLNSEHIIATLGLDYLLKIQINLREEDFAQNVSSFVCHAASRRLPGNLTVAGRLVTARAPAADVVVPYRAGDHYNATCAGPHAHWISATDAHRSLQSKTFTKNLEKEDDGMKLICVVINCEEFESNHTCYKIIMKEVTFRLKAPQGYGVIVGAVGALLVLLGAVTVACVKRARRRRRAPRDIARRPRMPTPPPERPPRRQPYYTVPFERPIPGPRRD